MNKFKTLKQFDLRKSLNNTASDSWGKIQIKDSWGALADAFRKYNDSMFSGKKFKSQEVYQDFSKFINPDTKVIIDWTRAPIKWKDLTWQNDINDSWKVIMSWFEDANKMFENKSKNSWDPKRWLVSQEAYEFLKKYIGEQVLNIRYSPGYIFSHEEFKNDNLTLNDQVEMIIVRESVPVIPVNQNQFVLDFRALRFANNRLDRNWETDGLGTDTKVIDTYRRGGINGTTAALVYALNVEPSQINDTGRIKYGSPIDVMLGDGKVEREYNLNDLEDLKNFVWAKSQRENPITDQNWNNGGGEPLNDVEMGTIKGISSIKGIGLDTGEEVHYAALLMANLRAAKNNKILSDWDEEKDVIVGIPDFNSPHDLVNAKFIARFAQAVAKDLESPKGKAWTIVNMNLFQVARHVHERYESLKNEQAVKEAEQVMKKTLEETQNSAVQLQAANDLKEKTYEAAFQIIRYLHQAELIERSEEDKVLGKNWQLEFSKLTTPEAVQEKQEELIKAIIQRQKEKQEELIKNEAQIQTEINNAQNFINRFNLAVQDSHELLEKLKFFQTKWAGSANPAERQAFLNKEDALNKTVEELKIKIRCKEAIQLITQSLNQEPRLQDFDLGDKFVDFPSKIRQMDNEETINEYENEALVLSAPFQPIRPIQLRLKELIDSANIILDSNNNTQEAQQNRQRILDTLIGLEKFRDSSRQIDESTWLVYIKMRKIVNQLVNTTNGTLFQEVRKQASDRLTEKKTLLEIRGITVDQNLFTNYQQRINRASSQELQSQKWENEFLTKVLENQQTQIINRQ